ncbi:MAG: ABC transporter ATP-binding protein [Microbacteriaceae bacterium]|nr:ABC transporter ATP-binding protein [Microbacteriaceae bacterium]
MPVSATPDSTSPAIELVGIEKAYGQAPAVRHLDLTIAQGEFFSLLGPSGCGKTTTLRMMAGFEFPDAGSIRLDGHDVTEVPAHRRQVNLVFQKYELFPHMTVRRNVGYGLKVRRVPRAEIDDRVDEMLETVGVGAFADRRADQLSGGQQQRVALARALVNRPRALLLDEPLSALDVKLRKRMQLELKSIQERLGTTFVYVTHDQEEALLMSDRIGIMNDGRLLQVGTPREIYGTPADPFVADFVGELNAFEVEVRKVGGRVSGVVDGSPVDVPSSASTGKRWRIAVRPERMEVGPAGRKDALHGRVTELNYLGHTLQYSVETAVGELVVRAGAGDVEREPGSAVSIWWAADAVIDLGEATP